MPNVTMNDLLRGSMLIIERPKEMLCFLKQCQKIGFDISPKTAKTYRDYRPRLLDCLTNSKYPIHIIFKDGLYNANFYPYYANLSDNIRHREDRIEIMSLPRYEFFNIVDMDYKPSEILLSDIVFFFYTNNLQTNFPLTINVPTKELRQNLCEFLSMLGFGYYNGKDIIPVLQCKTKVQKVILTSQWGPNDQRTIVLYTRLSESEKMECYGYDWEMTSLGRFFYLDL